MRKLGNEDKRKDIEDCRKEKLYIERDKNRERKRGGELVKRTREKLEMENNFMEKIKI